MVTSVFELVCWVRPGRDSLRRWPVRPASRLGGILGSTSRRAGSAAVGLALLATLFASASEASAAQKVSAGSVANCSGITGRNDINGPVARWAGQRINVSTPIHNTSGTTRSDMTVNYMIIPMPESLPLAPGSPAHRQRLVPTVYWQVDKGRWETMTFVWHPAVYPDAAYWLSEPIRLPTFAGNATHTFQISEWFHPDSLEALYWGELNYAALGCGADRVELGSSEVDTVYGPIFRR